MLIATRNDFDVAPEADQQRFLRAIATGAKRWVWTGKKWELQSDYSQAEKFGFAKSDLPEVPDPTQPDHNPDEREQERKVQEGIESRRQAYRAESDAIYFMWQRGEATEQEWLDAVQAIKARYPKP